MSFQWPLALIGLAVVPALVALYVVRERRRETEAARFANPALLPNLADHSPGWRRHLPLAVLLVALAALIVGVARPHATLSVKREEATVILAVDVSRSMQADDIAPTRLEAARRAAKAFLARVPSKFRVGIVAIGSRALVVVPPTNDRSLAASGLDELRPSEGTAIGDSITLAVSLGQRQRSSDGVVPPEAVLMISDGTPMGGRTSVSAAIRKARPAHVPVYAVLVGTSHGVVQATLTGGLHAVIQVPPSPGTLRRIAQTTGGEFFTATSDARLRDVYERLGSRLGHREQSREITNLFAGGSFALMLLGGGLSALWFRRLV